jgi:hypothetical protein
MIILHCEVLSGIQNGHNNFLSPNVPSLIFVISSLIKIVRKSQSRNFFGQVLCGIMAEESAGHKVGNNT